MMEAIIPQTDTNITCEASEQSAQKETQDCYNGEMDERNITETSPTQTTTSTSAITCSTFDPQEQKQEQTLSILQPNIDLQTPNLQLILPEAQEQPQYIIQPITDPQAQIIEPQSQFIQLQLQYAPSVQAQSTSKSDNEVEKEKHKDKDRKRRAEEVDSEGNEREKLGNKRKGKEKKSKDKSRQWDRSKDRVKKRGRSRDRNRSTSRGVSSSSSRDRSRGRGRSRDRARGRDRSRSWDRTRRSERGRKNRDRRERNRERNKETSVERERKKRRRDKKRGRETSRERSSKSDSFSRYDKEESEPTEPSNRLFVANCDFRCTSTDVSSFFKTCKGFQDFYFLKYDRGAHCGFGFANFDSIENAEAAKIEIKGQKLKGRELAVRTANPKSPEDPSKRRRSSTELQKSKKTKLKASTPERTKKREGIEKEEKKEQPETLEKTKKVEELEESANTENTVKVEKTENVEEPEKALKEEKEKREEKQLVQQEAIKAEETSDDREESKREKEENKEGREETKIGKEETKEKAREEIKVEKPPSKESGLLPLPSPLPLSRPLPLIRGPLPQFLYPSFAYSPSPFLSSPSPSFLASPFLHGQFYPRFNVHVIPPHPASQTTHVTSSSSAENPISPPVPLAPSASPGLDSSYSPNPSLYSHAYHHAVPQVPSSPLFPTQPRKTTAVTKNSSSTTLPSHPSISPPSTSIYSPHTPPSPMALESPPPERSALLPDPFPRYEHPTLFPPSYYFPPSTVAHPHYLSATPSYLSSFPHGFYQSFNPSSTPAPIATPTPASTPHKPAHPPLSPYHSSLSDEPVHQSTRSPPPSPPHTSHPLAHPPQFPPPAPSSSPSSPEPQEPPSALELRIHRILRAQEERHAAAYHHLEQKMNQIRQLAENSAQSGSSTQPCADDSQLTHGNFAAIEALANYNKTGSLSQDVVDSSSYRANSALYNYLKILAVGQINNIWNGTLTKDGNKICSLQGFAMSDTGASPVDLPKVLDINFTARLGSWKKAYMESANIILAPARIQDLRRLQNWIDYLKKKDAVRTKAKLVKLKK